MQVIVLATEQQRQELSTNLKEDSCIQWLTSLDEIDAHPNAEVIVDLLFLNEVERVEQLKKTSKRIVINSVADTLGEIDSSFVRINGWNTFLSNPLIEAATANEAGKEAVEKAFLFFNKQIEWLPDQPGFVTARVVSMIINEAYLALGEGISTKAEIDTAMKLGTAYPYGPFEWAEKIGVQRIVNLLKKLAAEQPKYKPAELLAQPIQL